MDTSYFPYLQYTAVIIIANVVSASVGTDLFIKPSKLEPNLRAVYFLMCVDYL